MKKYLLISLLLFGGITSAYSQSLLGGTSDDIDQQYTHIGFYAGLGVGIPTGDLGEVSSFTYGAAVGYYVFGDPDGFSIAPELNYTHYVGEDIEAGGTTIEVDGFDFLGVSARVNYALSSKFGVGGNVGYGKFLEENGDDEPYVTVGLDIRPVPGLIIRPEVTFNNGEEYAVRVYRTF